MAQNIPTRLASLEAGADRAGVSTSTLRRWIKSGRIAGYRAGPKLLKVDLDELEGLLQPVGTRKDPVRPKDNRPPKREPEPPFDKKKAPKKRAAA